MTRPGPLTGNPEEKKKLSDKLRETNRRSEEGRGGGVR